MENEFGFCSYSNKRASDIFFYIKNNDEEGLIKKLWNIRSEINSTINIETQKDILITSLQCKCKKSIIQLIISNFNLNVNDINVRGSQGLFLYCCYLGYIQGLEVLLSFGAKIDVLDSKNRTCLMISIINKDLDIFKYLIEQKDIYKIANIKESIFSRDLLMILCDSNNNQALKILFDSKLIDYINFSSVDVFGNSALELAIKNENIEICKLFLEKLRMNKLNLPRVNNIYKTLKLKNNQALIQLFQKANFVNKSQVDENNTIASLEINEISELKLSKSHSKTLRRVKSLSVIKENEQIINTKENNKTIVLDTPNGLKKEIAISHYRKNSITSKKSKNISEFHKEQQTETHEYSCWYFFTKAVTFLIFPTILEKIVGIKNYNQQHAWREKVSLCIIVTVLSLCSLFFLSGLQDFIICNQKQVIYQNTLENFYSNKGYRKDNPKYVSIRGSIYNVGEYFFSDNDKKTSSFSHIELGSVIEKLYGSDISNLFPVNPIYSQCKNWPQNYYNQSTKNVTCNIQTKDRNMHCHTSKDSLNALDLLKIDNVISFTWKNITNPTNLDKLIVIKDKVYRVDEYLNKNYTYLGEEMTYIIRNYHSSDATREFLKYSNLNDILPCLDDQFLAGKMEGMDFNCFASSTIITFLATILSLSTFVKITGAVLFRFFTSKRFNRTRRFFLEDESDPDIIFLVTCYSENMDSIKTTLNSIACSDYENSKKLLFIVADGNVVGSENTESTPDILKRLMTPFNNSEVIHEQEYVSIGDQSYNKAKVYYGFYINNESKIPYILVIKTGSQQEKLGDKAGNRGKRDSQIILMNLFNKVCYNNPMTPLEFDLLNKINKLTKKGLDIYELVLMVDADTLIEANSVKRMCRYMQSDYNIMGSCGEIKIKNKEESWVTKIQIYEYFISHYLSKSFESLFGGVTCLPGCFSMYRIKAPKGRDHKYYVPLLVSNDIINHYASNDISSLHKKNLILLGEDRYLSTLMLKFFPKRKTVYVPDAICQTNVPDTFKVLLSQRRRWINSTIHNLYELIFVSQLCGIFCCSMQFVVFLELIGTILMPVSFVYIVYLLIFFLFDSSLLLPLLFILLTTFVQSLTLIFVSKKMSQLYWFFVYCLATPIWNVVLPLYAFWNFDDFTWGDTRKTKKIVNSRSNHEKLCLDEELIVKFKTLDEWKTIKSKNLKSKKDTHKHRSIYVSNVTENENKASDFNSRVRKLDPKQNFDSKSFDTKQKFRNRTIETEDNIHSTKALPQYNSKLTSFITTTNITESDYIDNSILSSKDYIVDMTSMPSSELYKRNFNLLEGTHKMSSFSDKENI